MSALFDWLTLLASIVYGAAVIGFAVLLAVYPRASGRPRAEIARAFRAAGPVIGLSMGAWVLGMLASRYLATGTVTWGWSTAEARLDLATWGVFGLLWLSSFVLEIWTMEPLRTAVDADDRVTDEAAFADGYRRTGAHLALNAALVLAWAALSLSWAF